MDNVRCWIYFCLTAAILPREFTLPSFEFYHLSSFQCTLPRSRYLPASLQLYLNFALPSDDADFSPSQSTIQNHILHPYGYLFASVTAEMAISKELNACKSKGIRELPVSRLPLFDKMNTKKLSKDPCNLLIYFLRDRTRDI